MKKKLAIAVFALTLVVMTLLLIEGGLLFYAVDGIERAINDPPAGKFLYEDEQIHVETGKHKLVSIGGRGDNATYRHFIRQLLYWRDGIDMDMVYFQTDPYWDDYYIRVQYKVEGHRTEPALQSVKDLLDPDGLMLFNEQPDGSIMVVPPPPPLVP